MSTVTAEFTSMKKPLQLPSVIFLACCCALILFNVFHLFRTLCPSRTVGFAGLKFSGLAEVLENETHIGYVSDLNIREAGPLAEYEQAQYVLAPVILDVERPAHKFVIINSSNDDAAIAILKKLNARPLMRNQFGVILATTEPETPKTESVRP
jgi:hypothetical protein